MAECAEGGGKCRQAFNWALKPWHDLQPPPATPAAAAAAAGWGPGQQALVFPCTSPTLPIGLDTALTGAASCLPK